MRETVTDRNYIFHRNKHLQVKSWQPKVIVHLLLLCFSYTLCICLYLTQCIECVSILYNILFEFSFDNILCLSCQSSSFFCLWWLFQFSSLIILKENDWRTNVVVVGNLKCITCGLHVCSVSSKANEETRTQKGHRINHYCCNKSSKRALICISIWKILESELGQQRW